MTFQYAISPDLPTDDEALLDHLGFLSSAFTLSFVRACPDCVCLLDPQGNVQFINRVGRELLGLSRDVSMAGLTWRSLWPDAAREDVQNALEAAMQGQSVRCEASLGYVNAPEVRCSVTIAPVRNSRGAVEALTAILREIPADPA